MAKQRILIIGHSFVRRLKVFVQKKRHMHAFSSLSGMADIYFHRVGGRTIAKFRKFDFNVVRQLVPDVIILELSSNDLAELSPQTVTLFNLSSWDKFSVGIHRTRSSIIVR